MLFVRIPLLSESMYISQTHILSASGVSCSSAASGASFAMGSPENAAAIRLTPLAELVNGSAGFGRWKVKVVGEAREREYSYQWDGKQMKGRSFTIMLLSDDPTQYCYGKYTRRGKEPKATQDFDKAKARFKDGTVWFLSKATLTKEKPLYIGSR